MKRLKKFMRETRTGGMLGCKRRSQLKQALFAVPLLLFMLITAFVSAPEETTFASLAMAAPIGFTLIGKAKKEEDLTEEEKETLGTIQQALAEGIEKYRKGTITADELTAALEKMKKEILDEEEEREKRRKKKEDDDRAEEEKRRKKKEDEQCEEQEEQKRKRKKESEELEEENKKRDKRIKEAVDLIEEVRKVVSELAGELEDQKKKGAGFTFGQDNDFVKSIRESFASDKFKAFATNTSSKSSGEFELKGFNKNVIRKGTVSFESSYTGNVLPAYQSDVVVTEVPLQGLNIRDFMTVIDASEEEFTSYAFARIYDIDRAAAAVSENGELPEGSFKVKEVICETHRIGWHLPVSKRMLRKLRVLENKIMTLLPSGMLRQENFQILYGDSRDTNFEGIQQLCPTEQALVSHIYNETAAGKVLSIEGYDGGTKTRVNLAQGYAKMETGMKVTFAGFSNAAMNGSFELEVCNDHSIIVPVPYTAEADASVKGSVTFSVDGVWGQLVVDANKGDAIQVAVSSLNFHQYMPNLIVMNPVDYCALCSMKDRNGRKIVGDYVQVNNGIPYFGGVIPIAQLDCIAKGYFATGDFKNGCELIDTQRGYMELAEDVRTKLTNQVETIISEEVIFAVTVPDAFIYANFDRLIQIINADSTFLTNVRVVAPLNGAGDAVLMEVK